jgi:hypothetical protein
MSAAMRSPSASRPMACAMERTICAVSAAVRGMELCTATPASRSRRASSARFSSSFISTRSGASAMMRSSFGFFVPPTASMPVTHGDGMHAELRAPDHLIGSAEVVQEFGERGAERNEAHAAV